MHTPLGPLLRANGGISQMVRGFCADKHGIHPHLRTEPRLREEPPSSQRPG